MDVTDPTDMQVSTLVGNTGTTPNGVTVVDQTAYVVNWGNASVLAIDVETGEQSTVLGNLTGQLRRRRPRVGKLCGQLMVSSGFLFTWTTKARGRRRNLCKAAP